MNDLLYGSPHSTKLAVLAVKPPQLLLFPTPGCSDIPGFCHFGDSAPVIVHASTACHSICVEHLLLLLHAVLMLLVVVTVSTCLLQGGEVYAQLLLMLQQLSQAWPG